MLRRLIGEDIELGHALAPRRDGRVRADPGKLEQVLMNLAVNARDAMPRRRPAHHRHRRRSCSTAAEPRPAGRVRARAATSLLTVTDTGSGIDRKSDMPHIFEPFYTTKPQGQGTGPGPGDRLRHRAPGRRARPLVELARAAAPRWLSIFPRRARGTACRRAAERSSRYGQPHGRRRRRDAAAGRRRAGGTRRRRARA